MAFSEETIKQAWQRSGGKCECRRVGHDHHYGWETEGQPSH